MIIKCPNCGKEISSTSKTCVHCGHKMVKKGKTRWLPFVIGAVALLGAVFVFLLSKKGTSSEEGTISKKFSEMVNQSEYVSSCFQFGNETSAICVKQNGKYGLLNTKGEFVLPCEYDSIGIRLVSETVDALCVKKDGKFGLINSNGELLIPYDYDSEIGLINDAYSKSLALVSKGGKYGVLNLRTLSEIIPCQYEYSWGQRDFEIAFAGEDLLWLKKNGKYALINGHGNPLTGYLYSEVFNNVKYEICPVCKNGEWGFVDKTGKELPNSFHRDGIYYASGKAAFYRSGFNWIYFDTNGNELSESDLLENEKTVYDVVGTKYANYSFDGTKYGTYGREDKFYGGFAIVHWFDERINKAFYGLIDEQGNEVIRPSSDGQLENYLLTAGYVYKSYNNEYSQYGEEDNIGILDVKGNVIIPCENENIEYLGNGLFVVKKSQEYGLFQANMGYVTTKRYNSISTDFGYTQEGHTYWHVPLKYIDNTDNKLIAVEDLSGGWGIIDRTGIEITECVYDEVRYSQYPIVIVMKNDKWGLVDLNGQEVADCVYDEICDFSCGLARVKKGNKYGFVDTMGNSTFPKQ